MNATDTKGMTLITGALRSSKPGFQRLSKAALSRSRFLRLAAGALLPFVGLRLPAAAATNPELAQNQQRARDQGCSGAGPHGGHPRKPSSGPSKFIPTSAPPTAFSVNTQMVEGPNAVVIFDGQLLLPYADEVASYVQTLGKRLPPTRKHTART